MKPNSKVKSRGLRWEGTIGGDPHNPFPLGKKKPNSKVKEETLHWDTGHTLKMRVRKPNSPETISEIKKKFYKAWQFNDGWEEDNGDSIWNFFLSYLTAGTRRKK